MSVSRIPLGNNGDSVLSPSSFGVETNESSRFQDYTIVTPFEEMIDVVQKCIVKCVHDEDASDGQKRVKGVEEEEVFKPQVFDYLESKVVLTFHVASQSDVCDNMKSLKLIERWFHIQQGTKYLILSKQSEWTLYTTSERRYLLGALIAGLKASECDSVLVFCTSSTIESLMNVTEIIGYSLFPCDDVSGSTIFRYESHLSSNIAEYHPYFFLDGIKALFLSMSPSDGNDDVNEIDENFAISMGLVEKYKFPCDEIFDESREIIGKDISIWIDKYETNGKSLGFLEYILSHSDHANITNLPMNRLSDISIELNYDDLSKNTVDNKNYTNLMPSQVEHYDWKMMASYNDDHRASRSMGNTDIYSLSSYVRRLLSFYIYGKSVPSGWNMSNLLRTEGLDKYIDTAKSISTILSKRSRYTLYNLCHPVSIGEDSLVQQKQKMYELLFPTGKSSNYFMQSNTPSRFRTIPGSWLSLCSIITGSIDGDMKDISEFWAMCMGGLRNCFEEYDEKKDPASINNLQCQRHCDIIHSSRNLELWENCLWNDILTEKNMMNGLDITIPDLDSHLAVQKMQMLQFCAVMKHEDRLFLTPEHTCENVGTGIINPPLLRRLPSTTDKIKQINIVTSRLEGDNKNDDGNLKWHILYPNLISDIKSFKALNPDSTSQVFKSWYCKTEENFPLKDSVKDNFEDLWKSIEACPAYQQRAFFHADTEAEKCISFFESFSPIQFAAEMLVTGLETILVLLEKNIIEAEQDKDSQKTENKDFVQLCKLVVDCVSEIRMDTPEFGLDDNMGDAISQSLLVNVDRICNLIQNLEEYCYRSTQIRSLFSHFLTHSERANSNCIISRLAKSNETNAISKDEGRLMHTFTKNIAASRRSHEWFSTDARELGCPVQKTFHITNRRVDQEEEKDPKPTDRIIAELDTLRNRMRISTVRNENSV